jgi:hypothetical protein
MRLCAPWILSWFFLWFEIYGDSTVRFFVIDFGITLGITLLAFGNMPATSGYGLLPVPEVMKLLAFAPPLLLAMYKAL